MFRAPSKAVCWCVWSTTPRSGSTDRLIVTRVALGTINVRPTDDTLRRLNMTGDGNYPQCRRCQRVGREVGPW